MMKLLLKSLLRFINKLSVVASFSEMVMSTRFITRECVYHPRVHTEYCLRIRRLSYTVHTRRAD